MVSDDTIRPRLANFVCVRLGWEAMQQAKKQHSLLGTTQGNQVLLDVRQFTWERGATNGPSRIIVR